jgi:DNA repair protein RecN (Recombination protein N)
VLAELAIRDFAIIEELHLHFAPGFNVLTGETGAGKSIIIDAVSLLLGARGTVDFIRAGASRAVIEGLFALDQETQTLLNPILEDEGLDGDDASALALARELRQGGRSVSRINGRAVTVGLLREVGQVLVDIHGQTEHLSLMRVREHIDLLDRFGDLWAHREVVAGLVSDLRGVRRELEELRQDERELARRVDLLRYQVGEIEAARLETGEEETLALERARLSNAEKLVDLSEEAFGALYRGSDEQLSAIDLLQVALRALSALSKLDGSSAAFDEQAQAVSFQLEDLTESLRGYREGVEFDPQRLAQVEDRLALIRNLKRKYGDCAEDILAFAQSAHQELDTIEHSEERISELEALEQRLLLHIGRVATELSALREQAGERLSASIEAELNQLSMARARFGVEIGWRDQADGVPIGDRRVALDSTGIDRVEFLVAPNVGEPLKPLVRIASGGETSRLMLALKTVLVQADRTPTLIFDEIDAGIGGRVGSVVGEKLWGLTMGNGGNARRHQVLCVTHLAQLAGYADMHLRVSKGLKDERTVTDVQAVEHDDRAKELAGMLGSLAEWTLASAQEILDTSRHDKERQLRSYAQEDAAEHA